MRDAVMDEWPGVSEQEGMNRDKERWDEGCCGG